MALLFMDGFDHYASPFDATIKWTSPSSLAQATIAAGRISGQSMILSNGSALSKSIANIQTVIAGTAFKCSGFSASGAAIILGFRESATLQIHVSTNSLGQLTLYRNGTSGTLLATSTQSLVLNVWNYIELKAKIASGTSGTYELRVNGQVWLVSAAANTLATSNAYATDLYLAVPSGQSFSWYFDDLYLADTSGSVNNDFLGEVRVQTLYPTADVSKQMSPALIMGNNPYLSQITTTAPGANVLNLQKFVCPATGTVTQILLSFGTANSAAKVKAVIYSDSSGSPGSLLTNGTSAEVVGAANFNTAGVLGVYTFATPPSVTGGSSYWIGYITDTSLSFSSLTNSATAGTSKYVSNTYTSGAPASPTGFTNNSHNLLMAAIVLGGSTDYTAVGETYYDGDCSYAYDTVAGHVDRYSYGSLASSTASVKGVQVNPIMKKTDVGPRTARYNLITSATTANGTTQYPGTGYQDWLGVHNVQADGTTAWTVSAVNALNVSTEIVS